MIRDLSFLEFGHFVLASGKHTNVKIVVEKLLEHRWEHIERLLLGSSLPREWLCNPIYGVPTGGISLANKLFTANTPESTGSAVVIDDVWTTGGTVRRFIEEIGIPHPLVWVMFLRGEPPTDIPFAYHIDARNLPLWEPDECPICGAEVEVIEVPAGMKRICECGHIDPWVEMCYLELCPYCHKLTRPWTRRCVLCGGLLRP